MSDLINFLERSKGMKLYELRTSIIQYKGDEFYKFENMAISFLTHGEYDYNIESYFKPFMTVGDQVYPQLKDISLEAINHWRERATNTENIVLRSRYADLVWNFSILHQSEVENPYQFAETAINSYLEIIEQQVIENQLILNEYLLRALNLAKKLNQKDKIMQIQSTMISVESQILEDESIGLWGFSFDELITKKASITEEQEKEIIQLMHDRLDRLVSKSKSLDDKDDHWNAIEYTIRKLAKYYQLKDNKEILLKLLVTLEEIIDNSESQFNVKDYRYKRLLDLYKEVQITSENSRLLVKIEKASKENLSNLQEVSSQFELSEEKIKDYISLFISEDIHRDINAIAYHFIPKIDEHEKRLIEREKQGSGILSEMFNHVLLNEEGMATATLDMTKKENRLANEMQFSIPFQAQFLGFVLPEFFKQHDLKAEEFANYLNDTPIHSKEYNEFLIIGLTHYFQEDYISMVHVLIPYVEATLRNIANVIGLNTYKPNKKGGYDSVLLGDILSIDRIKNEVLGEDIHFYLKLVLNDVRGLNLRNIVAHGLCTPSMLNQLRADLIIHILMILSGIKERPDS